MQTQHTPSVPLRAAIYCRVSSKKQEAEGFGLDFQERACRALAERRGWTVVESHVYREAFTGTELETRPKLTAIRNSVPRKQFDVVLSYDIDRVQREDWFYGYIRDEWKPYNVRWIFVTEPDFNSEQESEDYRALTGMLARWKRQDQLRKTRNGRIERGRQGFLVTGNQPLFGYEFADVQHGSKVRKRAAYKIVEEEAAVVRRLFQQLYDGTSLNSIAKELNQRGVRTKKGGKWWPKTITNLITHPAYKGRRTNFTSRGNITMRDVEAVALSEDICPRIVEPELWESVQPRLAENKKLNQGSTKDPTRAWLKGSVVCGYCGKRMRTHDANGRNGYKYECDANRFGLDRCPASPTISARKLDAEVCAEIRAQLETPVWINSQAQQLTEALDKLTEETSGVEDRLRTLSKKKTAQWEIVEDTPRELRIEAMQRLATTEHEIEHWEKKLTERRARVAELTEQRKLVETLSDVEGRTNYLPSAVGSTNFDSMGFEEWRKIFRIWQPIIQVYRDGHEPRWRLTSEIIVFEGYDLSRVTEDDIQEFLEEGYREFHGKLSELPQPLCTSTLP